MEAQIAPSRYDSDSGFLKMPVSSAPADYSLYSNLRSKIITITSDTVTG
ncbi:MAG: hypothetical protein IPP60_04990 [Sphingobacteriales bacterium]|nr:hypothetical protein [Sphingobacteriales bacterium]